MSKTLKKQNKKLKPQVVICDWEDHWSAQASWQNNDDHTPLIVKSAGIKIYEDRKVLQISTHVDPEGKCGNIMTILKKCIVKRRDL